MPLFDCVVLADNPPLACCHWSGPGHPAQLEGVQPLTNSDDNAAVEVIAKSDPRVIAIVKERYGYVSQSSLRVKARRKLLSKWPTASYA